MKKALGVLVAAALLLLTVGCQQPAPKEWDVPFLNSLTGAIASIGEYLEWGAERAAKEINAAGGIKGKPVKIVGSTRRWTRRRAPRRWRASSRTPSWPWGRCPSRSSWPQCPSRWRTG